MGGTGDRTANLAISGVMTRLEVAATKRRDTPKYVDLGILFINLSQNQISIENNMGL